LPAARAAAFPRIGCASLRLLRDRREGENTTIAVHQIGRRNRWRYRMKRFFVPLAGLAGAIALAGAAMAGSAEEFAAARLAAFGKGDVAALTAGYRPDAVIVMPGAVIDTPEGRRAMIEGIVSEFAQPGVTFELLSQTVGRDVVEFTWKAETPANVYLFGTDTYVLEDGMIRVHTVATATTPK